MLADAISTDAAIDPLRNVSILGSHLFTPLLTWPVAVDDLERTWVSLPLRRHPPRRLPENKPQGAR